MNTKPQTTAPEQKSDVQPQIAFPCQHCSQTITVDARKGGSTVVCSSCLQVVTVPLQTVTAKQAEPIAGPATPPKASPAKHRFHMKWWMIAIIVFAVAVIAEVWFAGRMFYGRLSSSVSDSPTVVHESGASPQTGGQQVEIEVTGDPTKIDPSVVKEFAASINKKKSKEVLEDERKNNIQAGICALLAVGVLLIILLYPSRNTHTSDI